MKKSFRFLSLLLILCTCLVVPVCAEKASYISKISFDDVETNGVVSGITVDGTENARVIEYKNKEKGFFLPTTYKDTVITVPFDEKNTFDGYIVSFDIKYELAPVDVTVSLKTEDSKVTNFIVVDKEQKAYSSENKYIGGIAKLKFQNFAISVDNDRGCYSIYIDGKEVLKKWKLSSNLQAQSLQISAGESQINGSGLLIDNIKCYEGNSIVNEKINSRFNAMQFNFDEIDESSEIQNVYFKRDMNDISDLGVMISQKLNTIKGVYDESEENGYVQIDIESANDCYFEIPLATTSRNIVLECDVRIDNQSFQTNLFYLRDSASSSSNVNFTAASINTKGNLTSGGTTTPLTKKKWHKIACAIDLGKHVYTTYVDGNAVAKDKPFTQDFKQISLWRVYVGGNNQMGASVKFDNCNIYDGTEPRDVSKEEESVISVMTTDTQGEKYLKGKTALNGYSSKIYYANQKTDMDIPAITELGEMLVSVDTIKKVFGEKVSVSQNKITIGDNVTMNIGEKVMYVDKKPIEIEVAPRYENNALYIPSVAYAENGFKKKNVFHDDRGMILVSRDEVDKSLANQARRYLYFSRYSKEELIEKFDKATNNGQMHPRIMATADDFARLREEVKTSPTKKKWFERLLKDADKYMTEPLEVYEIINSRLIHVGQDNHKKLTDLAMAWQITGEEKYAERVYKELEALATFPDWHPQHTLDTGIISQSAAIGFDWIYDWMTEEQREFIARAFIERAVDPVWTAYIGKASFGTFWLTTDTNWNGETNGGIATMCLALAEYDKDYLMTVVENALRGMEYMWDAVAPDGAWFEGPGYWEGTVSGMTAICGAATVCFGEPFEFDYCKGMENLAMFPIYFSDNSDIANNFHDSTGTITAQNSFFQFYIANIYDNKGLHIFVRDLINKYNKDPHAFSLLYYDAECDNLIDGLDNLELDKRFRGTEFVSMREKWGDEGALWISPHGGELTNPHDHMDNGTYVMNLGGVRWSIDLGNDSLYYVTAKDNPAHLAGYDSFYYYRRKGEGHNIVVFDLDDKLEQDRANGTVSEFSNPVSEENGAYITLDLTDHYRIRGIENYVRGYKLTDGRRAYTVRDEIKLSKESEMYWFMHTNGHIVIEDNNNALIFQDGKVLKVQLLTNAKEAELSVMDPVSIVPEMKFENTANPNVTKLALKMKGTGDINITAKMSLYNEPPSQIAPDDTPISEWNVKNEKPYEYSYSQAKLKNIYLNGKALYGFKPDMFDYSSVLNEKGEIAQITCDSDYKTEISTYEMRDGEKLAQIRVYDENGVYNSYVIKFRNFVASDYSAYDRHQVKAVEASDEQLTSDPPNRKENSFDGDFLTRWSADGVGNWMIHDFGKTVEIDAFAAAFWNGGNRKYSYEVYVSDDKQSWTKVAEYTTSGKNENMETVVLKETVKARYVKYLGFGNTANTWNNVLEFAVLKKK